MYFAGEALLAESRAEFCRSSLPPTMSFDRPSTGSLISGIEAALCRRLRMTRDNGLVKRRVLPPPSSFTSRELIARAVYRADSNSNCVHKATVWPYNTAFLCYHAKLFSRSVFNLVLLNQEKKNIAWAHHFSLSFVSSFFF